MDKTICWVLFVFRSLFPRKLSKNHIQVFLMSALKIVSVEAPQRPQMNVISGNLHWWLIQSGWNQFVDGSSF